MREALRATVHPLCCRDLSAWMCSSLKAEHLLGVEEARPTVHARDVDLVAEVVRLGLEAILPNGLPGGTYGVIRVHRWASVCGATGCAEKDYVPVCSDNKMRLDGKFLS